LILSGSYTVGWRKDLRMYIFSQSIFFLKEEVLTNAITVFGAFFLKSSANSSRALHSLKRTGFLNYAGAENSWNPGFKRTPTVQHTGTERQ